MSEKYILDGKKPVKEPDLMKWATWFEESDRHVAITRLGNFKISTIFLGLDHSYGQGEPLLFETMIFDEKNPDNHLDYQERHSTWEQAEAGHKEAAKFVFTKLQVEYVVNKLEGN